MENLPRSTKLKNKNKGVYKYYAGFSEEFVEDILKILNISTNEVVLDPWNGSGTTTYVASRLGIPSIGVDINPVMSIIARARIFDINKNPYDASYFLKLSNSFRTRINKEDALSNWFQEDTVKNIRNIERAIFDGKFMKEVVIKNEYSDYQAFYCLILFNVVKYLANDLKTSNPTWIKKPDLSNRKSFTKEEIVEIFINEYNRLVKLYKNENVDKLINPKIIIGHSEMIPLNDSSINTVITSPPYLTRIDYAVMTSLELALLNISKNDFINLRHSLIGSPVIHKATPQILNEWGPTCLDILSKIKHHTSKASQTYYFKTYIQYFESIYLSFKELNRVLKNNGYCVIVIQNSYYKDIYIDLQKIFIEMVNQFGWEVIKKYKFTVANNLAEINPKSKEYRDNSSTNEFAIVFKKFNKR